MDTGGGGGGFMQQPMQMDNSSPGDKAKPDRNRQSLVPCTIKQLKNAPANSNGEQGYMLDGRELAQVTIVGLIISADEQSTNLMYTVDDGTDSIMVKMWVDSEADESFAERRAQWKEGAYVRVIGQLRNFNSTKNLVAYSIQPLTDFNEYSFHFIEVVHTHLRHTKGPPPAPAGMAPVGGMAQGGMAPQAGMGMGGAAPQAYGAPQQQGGGLKELVLSFFTHKAKDHDSGLTVQDATSALAGNGATIEQVTAIVADLTSDGHLYSTIDDDHFQATES